MESKKVYYIESSSGKIPFRSDDITYIRVNGRKQQEYINFKPINNRKFLTLADRYRCGDMLRDYDIYSKKTKNGNFLIFNTEIGEVEYKIFEDKNFKNISNDNDDDDNDDSHC